MDSKFSHKDKNIIGNSKLESGVTWKRPRYICYNPQLFVDGPSRFDIAQGNFLHFFKVVKSQRVLIFSGPILKNRIALLCCRQSNRTVLFQ